MGAALLERRAHIALLELLEPAHDGRPDLQHEAAWALTNLCGARCRGRTASQTPLSIY
jgi:hypothetical protein